MDMGAWPLPGASASTSELSTELLQVFKQRVSRRQKQYSFSCLFKIISARENMG